ncbi:hypothetical protein HYX05_02990 [Candidatus Woesearchaeota archaeon]|nr:hypothetical protein [Candidatus Woesearchaeota archaeon]
MSKIFNNKIAKGLVSFVTIILLLCSILATTFVYQNNITASVIREDSENWESAAAAIIEVDGINGLSQLNEGWYEVRNGFLFYLDTFNSYVPLYIRIADIGYKDGLLVVDGEGNVEFSYRINGVNEKVAADEENENTETSSDKVTAAAIRDITGDVTGGQTITKASLFQRWWCSCFYYLGNKPLKENEKFWDTKGNEYTVGILAITGFDKETRQPIYIDDVSKLPPNGFYVSKPQEDKTALLQEVIRGSDGRWRLPDGTDVTKVLYAQAEGAEPPAYTVKDTSPAPSPQQPPAPPAPQVPLPYKLDCDNGCQINGRKVEFVTSQQDNLVYKEENENLYYIVPKTSDNDVYAAERVQIGQSIVYITEGDEISVIEDVRPAVAAPPAPAPVAAPPATPPSQPPKPSTSSLPSPSAGQTIQLNIIDLTKKKPEEIGRPGAQGLPSTAEGPKIVEQHAVKISDTEYQIVTVYKDGDKQSVAINKATPEIKDNKITGFKVGETISTDAANPIILKDANLKQWTGKLDNVPIANGVRDASACVVNSPTCTYTDYFKDKSRSTTTITPTEKTTEKFGTLYYYNGKEITKAEYDKLQKEGKKVDKLEETTTFKVTEEKEGDTTKYLTTYQHDTIFDKDNNPTRVYEATKVNQNTGQIEEFIYGEGNQKIVIKTPGGVGISDIFKAEYQMDGDLSLLSKARTRLNQLASRQFFASVERVLTEFQGLGYYAPLFFDEDALLEWRDRVDRVFATLYLGTEYWSSSICGSYLDGEDEGIAYAETPQGYSQIGAHVEATRSEPLITPTGVEFLYKITFNIRNGDYDEDPRAPEEMEYNVVLKGERTVSVFRQPQTVERGSSSGRAGSSAIVKYSPALYTRVCLQFDKIPLRWKLDNGELCNLIVSTGGEATPVASSGASAPSAGSGTPSGEFNDF